MPRVKHGGCTLSERLTGDVQFQRLDALTVSCPPNDSQTARIESLIALVPLNGDWGIPACGHRWSPLGPRKTACRVRQAVFVSDCVVMYYRAGDGTRTHDVQLGKLAFYQLNYAREVQIG